VRKIRREVTRKVERELRIHGFNGSIPGMRLTQTPYYWAPAWARQGPAISPTPYLFVSVLLVQSVAPTRARFNPSLRRRCTVGPALPYISTGNQTHRYWR